jgi:hypothetical protein
LPEALGFLPEVSFAVPGFGCIRCFHQASAIHLFLQFLPAGVLLFSRTAM